MSATTITVWLLLNIGYGSYGRAVSVVERFPTKADCELVRANVQNVDPKPLLLCAQANTVKP